MNHSQLHKYIFFPDTQKKNNQTTHKIVAWLNSVQFQLQLNVDKVEKKEKKKQSKSQSHNQ